MPSSEPHRRHDSLRGGGQPDGEQCVAPEQARPEREQHRRGLCTPHPLHRHQVAASFGNANEGDQHEIHGSQQRERAPEHREQQGGAGERVAEEQRAADSRHAEEHNSRPAVPAHGAAQDGGDRVTSRWIALEAASRRPPQLWPFVARKLHDDGAEAEFEQLGERHDVHADEEVTLLRGRKSGGGKPE